MLPGFTAGIEAEGLSGWTGFRATVPDRLPIFGPTGVAGLCAATRLGSRGLLWAPLGAQLLACELEGEPWPRPPDLGGAAAPRRFFFSGSLRPVPLSTGPPVLDTELRV